jgi:hypothetical protein
MGRRACAGLWSVCKSYAPSWNHAWAISGSCLPDDGSAPLARSKCSSIVAPHDSVRMPGLPCKSRPWRRNCTRLRTPRSGSRLDDRPASRRQSDWLRGGVISDRHARLWPGCGPRIRLVITREGRKSDLEWPPDQGKPRVCTPHGRPEMTSLPRSDAASPRSITGREIASDKGLCPRAGDENRTRMTSLEDRGQGA